MENERQEISEVLAGLVSRLLEIGEASFAANVEYMASQLAEGGDDHGH